MYFEPLIIFKIRYFTSVYWLKNFFNISVCLTFIMHLPEDDHMNGRNMWEVHGVYNKHTFIH
jgi:hypothetical protein